MDLICFSLFCGLMAAAAAMLRKERENKSKSNSNQTKGSIMSEFVGME